MLETTSPYIKVSETVKGLKALPPKEQFKLIQKEIDLAAEGIIKGKSIFFVAIDDTPAGDAHTVSALYVPQLSAFTIEIPNEPSDVIGKDGQRYSRRGGRFPTVLHTIEALVVAGKLANVSSYPSLEFINTEDLDLFYRRIHTYEEIPFGVVIPLVYQPSTSNVLFFNKTDRRVNPRAVAAAHYDAVQTDTDLTNVLLRHTMLLEGTPEGGNGMVEIGVLDADRTKQHGLFRTPRIQSWDTIVTPPKFVGQRILEDGTTIRRYALR